MAEAIKMEDYPFIKRGEGNDLSRRIEITEGQVLCSCDGASKSVRECLSSTMMIKTDIDNMGEDRTAARCHDDNVKTCARLGKWRIDKLIFEAEKGLKV